jgi:hypothetical protein
LYPSTVDPPSEVKVHETVIDVIVALTKVGAVDIVGVDASMKVFLIENVPLPTFDVALTLY